MKEYIKKALKELQNSNQNKIEIELKNKNDYKKNFLRLIYNKFILKIQKIILPSHFKNWLLRTTGLKIGYDCCIPHYITFDPYFPELIEVGKGTIIGGVSTLISHEIKGNKLILGKIRTAERILIGGMSTLKPGSMINKQAILMFFSNLEGEVPKGEIWAGKPAKLLIKLTEEQIKKYFQPSINDPEYYHKFKKKVKEFRKDPNKNFFKMTYDGKRLNAGDDWYKARCLLRIIYNGILTELIKILPHSFFKIILIKMMGIKIGKNCKIGKGVLFDHLYGDLVTLEDNVTLEDKCYFDGHEYTTSQTIFGKTVIKKGAHIKENVFFRCGSTIGENTIVEANSFVQKELPPNTRCGGNPAKPLK